MLNKFFFILLKFPIFKKKYTSHKLRKVPKAFKFDKKLTFFLILIFSLSCNKTNSAKYLQIELKDLEENTISLSNYSGKIIILDFWASWCEPCKKAVPVIEQLRKNSNPEKVVFLGVNTDNDLTLEGVKKAAENFGIKYNSLLDPELKLVKELNVEGQPAIFVFDKKGEVIFYQYGLNLTDLSFMLKKLSEWEK